MYKYVLVQLLVWIIISIDNRSNFVPALPISCHGLMDHKHVLLTTHISNVVGGVPH